MRIAFCGVGSTGKTTLANNLLLDPQIKELRLKEINVDARKMLLEHGYHCIDDMTSHELQSFQRQYIYEKIKLENNEDNYLTQRSFVDAAAYWTVRDAVEEKQSLINEIVDLCKVNAVRYDIHIFIPFGQIPLVGDGFRSNNIEQSYRISEQMELFLLNWEIPFLKIRTGCINDRIVETKDYILNHISKTALKKTKTIEVKYG